MSTFKDLKPEEAFFAFTRIDEQTKRVSGEALSALDAGINFLFLTHAGGAVAVLSFLGNPEGGGRTGALFALALFSIGLILVGVIKAFRVHFFGNRSKTWIQATGLYFQNEIDWQEMNRRFEEASEEPVWPYFVGYLSFTCLVVGALTGFFLLVCAT